MKDSALCENNEINTALRCFLNGMLKEMMALVNAECGSLFLFDAHNEELVLNSFYNSANLRLEGLRQKVGEGISGKVLRIKEPILVKDIARDVRFTRNGFKHYRTNSFISVPLFSAKGTLLGLVNLADKSTGGPFSDQDLAFAVAISKYACLSIDNFYSYLSIQQEKEILDKQKGQLEKYACVGKLAAGIVHEINNPLDGIIRYANMLLDQSESSSISREYLLELKSGLNRIEKITKSLLEFSHQVNSSSYQVKNYADPHKLIDESLDLLNDLFSSQVKINRKYQEGLAKIVDFGLSHVFINLIKNALDAMPQGGELEVSTRKNGSFVEIIFQDSGIGMSEEVKEHLFEPFFTTKAIGKGTGLGLAICQEIVHKYEGNIQVESSEDKGSRFTILIPKKYLENG